MKRSVALIALCLFAGTSAYGARMDEYPNMATAPAPADELLIWDASATATKNVTVPMLLSYYPQIPVIGALSCSAGQVLQWSGTTVGWVCGPGPASVTLGSLGAEAAANKDINGGYVGRDASGNAAIPGSMTGGVFATTKEAGIPGVSYQYAAETSTTTGWGFVGPVTAAAARVIQWPSTVPNDGDVLAVAATPSSGSGTVTDPYIHQGTWVSPGTGGAPGTATYLTAQAESGLSSEVNLAALSSGYLYATVAGGVATISTSATNAAPADGKYLVGTSTPGLANQINLGTLSTGYLKATVTAGTASISTEGAFTFVPALVNFSTATQPTASDFDATKTYRMNGGTNVDFTLPTASASLFSRLSNVTESNVVVHATNPADVFTLDGTALSAGHYLTCPKGLYEIHGTGTNAWDVWASSAGPCVDGGADTYGALEVAPTSWDYSDTEAVTGSTPKTFVVTITDTVTFAAEPVLLTTGADFHIDSNTCTGQLTDTTCQTVIHFAPLAVGEKSDTLTYDSSVADLEVELTGTAVDTTAPTLTSITIGTSGALWTFVYDEPVHTEDSDDLCNSTDWTIAMTTAGAITLAYSGGDGTSTVTCTGTPTVNTGDTVANGGADYTQPGSGNGILDAADNELATLTDKAVTNNSTVGGSFTESFNDLTNWTQVYRTWSVSGGQLDRQGGSAGALVWTADLADNQHACIQIAVMGTWGSTAQGGLIFRSDLSGNYFTINYRDYSSLVRLQSYLTNVLQSSAGTDWSEDFNEGDYLCADVSGSSSSPTFRAWHFTTTPDIYTNWGAAGKTWTGYSGNQHTGKKVGIFGGTQNTATKWDNWSAGENQ